MSRMRLRHSPRLLAVVVAVALTLVAGGVALGEASINALHFFTPKLESQVTNIDVLRTELKNYYGTPGATTGSAAGAGWTLPLNLDSNYAHEAEAVAAKAGKWLAAQAKTAASEHKAIVLDVDDTTLTTWNYELYSNWDYNPATNGTFVTGQLFPATPGMVDLVNAAADMGYAVFFITGRPTAQEAATLGNLTSDGIGVDAGYPAPTALSGTEDGLFTKPSVGSYPDYLNTAEFCASAIAANKSCATIPYKSGTRAHIEAMGYDIVADFGDQYSDLLGGYTDMTFKLPNPNYYLP